MNAFELSNILKSMYERQNVNKTTMIHLFGIQYAKQIEDNRISPKEILKSANMPESYATEIYKGIRLSKYVDLK